MTDHAHPPLLFLDVDGTLLPYGGAAVPSAVEEWQRWQDVSNPQLAELDRAHGPRLRALPCVLMWATAWMHDANEVIAPLLGLPDLPVVDLPEESAAGELHWKTRALVELAAGRAFVWVDDEITERDRAWVEAHHRGHALLHRVEPMTGLCEGDLAVVDGWLRGSREQSPS
ncbi:hypothetical protein IPZ68_21880 [Streptomyces arenae]|nr:hypothetical protein [Streptomyces arenae]